MARRGFTLLEVALATVIGGMVILTSVGLFGLLERSETVLERQFTESRQLGTLQLVLRRSFNSILVAEDNSTSLESAAGPDDNKALGNGEVIEDDQPAWDGQGERPRIVLEFDHSEDLARCMSYAPPPIGDPMGVPQRLEMVLPRSPIPASLRLPTQGWLAGGVDIDNDLEVYGISGPVRGVFELRPDGSRELLLKQAGMTSSVGERINFERGSGWTLWWRPVFPEEVARLTLGIPDGEQDSIAAAAEAYPVIRGIKRARFLSFDNRFRKLTYAARTATDLPAYVEVEIETWAGQYVNWMFEIGWVNGADPTYAEEDTSTDDVEQIDDQNNDVNNNVNSGVNGLQQQNRRLGTQRQQTPGGRSSPSIQPQRRTPPNGRPGDGSPGGGSPGDRTGGRR